MKHLPGCNCTCSEIRREIDKKSREPRSMEPVEMKGNKLMRGDRVIVAL